MHSCRGALGAALLVMLACLLLACGSTADSTPALTATPEATAAATSPPPTATAATPAPTATPAATAVVAEPTRTPAPAPTSSPVATAIPAPPSTGPLVSLPQDEAPHETPVEWWYFNGFLRDEGGNEYSFHYVTFQGLTLPLGTPHLLHATLANHGTLEHWAEERPTLATLDPVAPSVAIDANGWVMRGDGLVYELHFALGGVSVDLNASSTREPVLHDSTGLVHLGEAGDTYYYSRTRMALDGMLVDAHG